MPLPIWPCCRLVTPFRQFCKLLIDQLITKSNTLLCLSCWYHYLKWFKVIFWLSGAAAIPHNTQLRSWGGVLLSMSRRFIFGSSVIHVWVRMRSLRSKLFPRSQIKSTFIRNDSKLTLQHILNSIKHAQKGWKLWKQKKNKPGDSENDHTVFESVAPSKLISNENKQ